MTTIEVPVGTKALNITQKSDRILFEFVPRFKEGDFLYSDAYAQDTTLIFKKIYNNHLYYYVCIEDGNSLDFCEQHYWTNIDDFRLATEAEQQQLLYVMKKAGKQWNNEELKIEDIPRFKEGDFIYQEDRIMIVHKYPHFLKAIVFPNFINDTVYYDSTYGFPFSSPSFRFATEEEKQFLLDALEKDGKKWNAEKLCIEDIPQRKFKPGDRVELKDGMLDKRGESPHFVTDMDVFIGKVLTVGNYNSEGYILLSEADGWVFAEDWLELYSDEPIVGELAIFWDSCKEHSSIKLYTGRSSGKLYTGHTTERHRDHLGVFWANAIKFISKEQFLEHIKD